MLDTALHGPCCDRLNAIGAFILALCCTLPWRLAQAYNATPPAAIQPIWSGEANIGDYSGFAPAGCNSTPEQGRLIGPVPEDIASYLFEWINASCVRVSACQTMSTRQTGQCSFFPEYLRSPIGALGCPGQKSIQGFNNQYCPPPTTVASFNLPYRVVVYKNCNGLPGTTFDTTTRACTCGQDSVWVNEIGRCKPVNVKDVSNVAIDCASELPQGNPIFPMRGTKRQTVDLGLKVGWLPVTLTYDSRYGMPGRPGQESPPSIDPGLFGKAWFSNLHRRAVPGPRILSTSYVFGVRVTRGDGTVSSFSADGAGFVPDHRGNADRLSYDSTGGYRYVDHANRVIETYDASGMLQRMDSADGSTLTFKYDPVPLQSSNSSLVLSSVTDNFGRSVEFSYSSSLLRASVGRSIKMSGDSYSTLRLDYDEYDRLSSIAWPDRAVRRMVYEAAAGAPLLTGILDELGRRYASFNYLGEGAAASTAHAGSVDQYTASYRSAPTTVVQDIYQAAHDTVFRTLSRSSPQTVTITSPNGSISSISSTSISGVTYATSQTQPAGSGCAASSKLQAYDVNGNVSSRDDFNGSRTCSSHDLNRNVELVRVEGLTGSTVCESALANKAALPAGSRKVSRQWHPDWRLPVKIAEPGRITTSIYNGQPDPYNGNATAACAPASAVLPTGRPIAVLCRRVEQATTDANGAQGPSASPEPGTAARQQTWTYNRNGQVLTHDGPRSDVADVTTFRYYLDTTVDHTIGDLQSATNAAGHTVQYMQYNKAGKLIASIDPNGVVTRNTYDLRQRQTSALSGAGLTLFSYDLAGQLVAVTRPDGSYLRYVYDDAHRLISVLDGAGNLVRYTLDNSGNRISEEFRDKSGTLRRQLMRSFDALGRIQSTIGEP